MRPDHPSSLSRCLLALCLFAAGGLTAGCDSDAALDAGPAGDAEPPIDAFRRDGRVASPDAADGPRDGGADGGAPDGGSPDSGPLCDGLSCPAGQRCELMSGEPACADAPCSSGEDCPIDRHCDGERCRLDACVAGGRRCDAGRVVECAEDGSGERDVSACASGSDTFTSTCVQTSETQAGCTCRDDWDCPAHTVCEAGLCEGSGREPTCSLPTVPFERALPSPEIVWGGTFAEPRATGSPFPDSTQVVVTPLVVNLDDDNGDGLVDELDFPEIVFVSYCGSRINDGGVLRAIHGGGPNAGADYFASCGATVWSEGMEPDALSCGCDGRIDPSAQLAAGDLDGDGLPEIVAIDEDGGVLVHDRNGAIVAELSTGDLGGVGTARSVYSAPAPAVANLDRAGLPEIVVGRNVFTLAVEGGGLVFVDRFEGTGTHGRSRPTLGLGSISCPADLVPSPGLEVVAGSTLYRLPRPPAGVSRRSECAGTETDPDHVAFCEGRLLTVWDGQAVNGTTAVPDERREGFCAVADLLGADTEAPPGPDNPLDEVAEIVLLANGWVHVYEAATGTLLRQIDLAGSPDGGAPNVDDFDGDGFPEIGTALGSEFIVVDLQPPTEACPAWPTHLEDGVANPNPSRTGGGAPCTSDDDCAAGEAACNTRIGECVCLHNGWRRRTEDGGEIHATGSSVFDFNGDGAVEVVYNDECWFRIYDGLAGTLHLREASESRTRSEYPAIADVDNDGNVEIVFATTTESSKCSVRDELVDGSALRTRYNAGVEVWGDENDYWVTGRRIWNQNAYHVTNVNEDGSLPLDPIDHWVTLDGRRYNLYRSNPRTADVAPDLTVLAVRVSSPDVACGTLTDVIDIAVIVRNEGDVRVGPGVRIGLEGLWTSPEQSEPLRDADGPLSLVLSEPLAPGQSRTLVVRYEAAHGAARPGELPAQVRVVADPDDTARECDEADNEVTVPVEAGEALPDLTIALSDVEDPLCSGSGDVTVTVANEGSAAAEATLVVLSAGDPTAGGAFLLQVPVESLEPGAMVSRTLSVDYPGRQLRLYGTIDPHRLVEECDESDNVAIHGPLIGCPLF